MGHTLQSLYLSIVPVWAEDVRMCDYTSKARIQCYIVAVFSVMEIQQMLGFVFFKFLFNTAQQS